MAGLKLFISQGMTGRKESEVRNERWFYYTLANLRWGSTTEENNLELINQFDAPSDMPIFEGSTTEERETKQSLWLLGRSIQMMKDADIVIMVGNTIESKGMMVEYEVIRQYNKNRNTWWFYTGNEMIEWARKNHPYEFLDIMRTHTSYCSNNNDELVVKEDKPKEERKMYHEVIGEEQNSSPPEELKENELHDKLNKVGEMILQYFRTREYERLYMTKDHDLYGITWPLSDFDNEVDTKFTISYEGNKYANDRIFKIKYNDDVILSGTVILSSGDIRLYWNNWCVFAIINPNKNAGECASAFNDKPKHPGIVDQKDLIEILNLISTNLGVLIVTAVQKKPEGSSYGTYYINPRALPDDETVASVIDEWIQLQHPIGNVYVHDLHTNGDATKWNFKTNSASKSVWLYHTDYSLYVISDGDPRDNLSNTRSCITIGPYGIGYYNRETFTNLTEEDFESLFDHLRKSFKLYHENE